MSPADPAEALEEPAIPTDVPPGNWCEGDPGFAAELRRRMARADSGEDPGFDADEVFAELLGP